MSLIWIFTLVLAMGQGWAEGTFRIEDYVNHNYSRMIKLLIDDNYREVIRCTFFNSRLSILEELFRNPDADVYLVSDELLAETAKRCKLVNGGVGFKPRAVFIHIGTDGSVRQYHDLGGYWKADKRSRDKHGLTNNHFSTLFPHRIYGVDTNRPKLYFKGRQGALFPEIPETD